MPRKRPVYPPEYRHRLVELARSGRSADSLAREFEPTAQTIRAWVKQADIDEGRREDGLTTVERDELKRLRRENRELKMEREILKKAAAWFARESDSSPKKGSGS
jgi:transposase